MSYEKQTIVLKQNKNIYSFLITSEQGRQCIRRIKSNEREKLFGDIDTFYESCCHGRI